MILTLKDIGKIKEARVELNGITVIAGENNTGKSTIGKTLFSIFNSFYKIEQQIYRERQNVVGRILEGEYLTRVNSRVLASEIEEFINNILEKVDIYKENLDLLQNDIIEFFPRNVKDSREYITEAVHENVAKKILQIISLPEDAILKIVLSKKLESEFNGQINNIYSDETGVVELNIKGNNVEILIENNQVKEISEKLTLNTEAIYIDDPFILDELRFLPVYNATNNYSNHRLHLRSKLSKVGVSFDVKDAINELVMSKQIESILSKINPICSGEMIKSSRFTVGYGNSDSEKVLNIKNTSTGLKTFIILKTLLLNGDLEENGTIILDEPEIHLHPEWQILFAEIIVLLQKEFNMHILLNTHSPYFLRAIQIYSAKHEIADKCKYYMAENIEDNQAIIKDVTTDIDEIYIKLAKPFEILENERYSDD